MIRCTSGRWWRRRSRTCSWGRGGRWAGWSGCAPSTRSGQVLATFDEVTFEDCFAAQVAAGASWADIGSACNGVGGTTTFVSTASTPSGGFLSKTGTISETETGEYYAAIGAPTNLDNFKAAYGFGPGDLTATYYNDGDLGLGREMHCKLAGASVACYVVNYSGVANGARFDQDPTLVLADAVAHTNSFATVAMVADPPFTGPNSIKFMVYGANGRLAKRAALDKHRRVRRGPQQLPVVPRHQRPLRRRRQQHHRRQVPAVRSVQLHVLDPARLHRRRPGQRAAAAQRADHPDPADPGHPRVHHRAVRAQGGHRPDRGRQP
ncbi:MAG: hypothetical protein IPL61_37050 [Myxococcales bacterium]|nr:hypothetical protein [Myxococcales bacterium]